MSSGLNDPFAIRLACEEDAESVLEIYGPICESSPISFETQSPTLLDIRGRIRRTLTVLPWLVIEHSGKVLGYAYAGRHRDRAAYRWSVDVTVYIHQRARQKQIGTALYLTLLHLLGIQGFYRAYAGITLPNVASIRLHERMGFQPVGVYHGVGHKLGAWHDVQWMEATLHNGNATPSDPIAISQIPPEYWKDAISKGQAVFA